MIIETPLSPIIHTHKQPEAAIQVECYTWFWNAYPDYRGLMFAVMNQNERSKYETQVMQLASGARRKAMGVFAGVSDIICLIPRGDFHGLMLECKTKRGLQSDEQKAWQAQVEQQGYVYRIFRSLDDFKEIVTWYLDLGENNPF